ncbi:sulfite exporter TauE/SafE family protein [Pseudotabrizicola algicola]|uniref:Probable membrane transporter protein n=1 Tax=Pseudotabrizicola algicola TaxID=2709381 RepID=A0A6B3RI61_9RHOB|nr:sulfite exporter TauE/SafE family protein [Pseudotabrizicola algicola]NEX45737.1 sulfite exporter TauE/SafE family protein [Pseudotabrizicola algicola]
MIPFGLSGGEAALVAAGMVLAGYVRGYSGFGFAALVMLSVALVTDPLPFVPVVILADIIMTAGQVRGIWTHIDWRRVGTLFAGCLVGVPLGVAAVASAGPDLGRAVLSVFVLAMCGLLLGGWRLARQGDGAHVAVGAVSGLANGMAVGGLPVAVFFTAQAVAPAVFRATVIAYFTALDLWSLPVLWQAEQITRDSFWAAGLGLPFMLVGLGLGSRRFARSSPQDFRRFAIFLLALLSGAGLIKSVM